MTESSNTSNWCPDCEDVCEDHARICTICGASLQERPAVVATQQQQGQPQQGQPSETATDTDTATDTAARTAQLRHLLGNIREQINDIGGRQEGLLRDLRDTDAAAAAATWEAAPAEAMDPGQGAARSRPTSRDALDKLPRIQLTKDSFLFRRAAFAVSEDTCRLPFIMEAVPGEFGAPGAFALDDAVVIVAQPVTGKGGLSPETLAAIQKESRPVILYMERGASLTFVTKANMAEKAGAVAVVMGNNASQPWPYIMKDSKGEAETSQLTIPVVMIKQSDGQSIVSAASASANASQQEDNKHGISCRLDIASQSNECVVCRDDFEPGQTAIRLPACGHVFHEQCACHWLKQHNTCPYCRRELPTDDAAYEQERRRTQRTHAGSAGTANNHWHSFYG